MAYRRGVRSILPGILGLVIERGTLHVRIGAGTTTITGRPTAPEATITLHDPAGVARRVLRGGSLGLAEAYIDGLWDTSDLAGLLELAARNNDARRGTAAGRMAMRGARRLWRRFRPGGPAMGAMVDHYNLGNDFYARWLDPSMSYSSARFAEGDDLVSAQQRKYDDIAELARIRPGDRVLEIGCGWGAMAEYLALGLGCSVTAVTNSVEHHEYATRRMKEAGVDDRVEIVLGDFRDVTGTYDRVVSIEMIESIDEAQWPDLYDVIERSLVPGGTATLQVITIDHDLHEEMVGRDDFIRSYIFPGGALPSIRILRRLGEDAGLEWVGFTEHGVSYARTLAAWDRRFVEAWPRIAFELDGFDDRFSRMWRFYFAYCRAGFRTGRIDGIQLAYVKPVAGPR